MKVINCNQIYKILASRKRISRFPVSEEEFQVWINTINAINDLEPEETQFNGSNIERYLVPKKLEGLVLPSRVCLFDVQRNSVDFRCRYNESYSSNEIMKAGEFSDISASICNAFKWDDSELVPIERKEVVLDLNIYKTVLSEDDYVNSESCRPLRLTLSDSKLDGFYGYEAEESFTNYIRDALK